MKWSKSFLVTFKEAPSDAEILSHQLMMRSGMIKKIGPGLYTYQHFALRSIQKFEKIIRDVLNSLGCQEVLMPMVHPASLWQETGRWDKMGDLLLKFKNRTDQEYCLGGTHEEVITDLVRNDLKSYKSLPVTLYQIQTKYRDEIRPRFGLMRCREFIMKDAYSFDKDQESAMRSYEIMYKAYQEIFNRLGMEYRIVEADAGAIGGSQTHEFQLLAEAGEDQILVSDKSDYAANIEIAPAADHNEYRYGGEEELSLEEFATPGLRTIQALSESLGIAEENLVKTMFVDVDGESIAVLLRGNDDLNLFKVKALLQASDEPQLLKDIEIEALTGAKPGSCGPLGLNIPVYADHGLKYFKNFIVGANKDDFHLKNVNFNRDFQTKGFFDLRIAKTGEKAPDGGTYVSYRGIEVGHCFYLGKKYSEAMKAEFLDQDGKSKAFEMGCYGIGVSRTVQACIEQSHDKNGIVWPQSIAPYLVHICSLDPDKDEIHSYAEKIYNDLWQSGIDCFMDDRKERPGVKFKDADLIGFPIRVTVGGRGIENNEVEISLRKTSEKLKIRPEESVKKIRELLSVK